MLVLWAGFQGPPPSESDSFRSSTDRDSSPLSHVTGDVRGIGVEKDMFGW